MTSTSTRRPRWTLGELGAPDQTPYPSKRAAVAAAKIAQAGAMNRVFHVIEHDAAPRAGRRFRRIVWPHVGTWQEAR